MLFSYSLLSRFVDLSSTTPEELRNRLTFSGFEVEGREPFAQASSLVIGEIISCEKHPDSDHLHCLLVDCGKEEGIKKIVCGAPNARKGLKVIVALPGCVLPALSETIKPGKIRGEESNGRCCSLVELGLPKEVLSEKQVGGIEELPSDAPVGEKDVLSYLGIKDEILDVNVLPNRPDCLSYIGLAREISSLTGYKLAPIPSLSLSCPEIVKAKTSSSACSRIDILSLRNLVRKEKTPLYIVSALNKGGIRSIDPIVDLGNYVRLVTGQPVNRYDAAKNDHALYEVKDDIEGKATTFDGKEVSLIKGDLVVTDGNTPLCLGGIRALGNSAIGPSTKDIDVEFADFYHANIRHTCSRLGLSSASSQLFGKGRNPKRIPEAIAFRISILPEFFSSYEIVSYSSDNKAETENKPFEFSYDLLNSRLGSCYTKEEIDLVLDRYRIKRVDGNKLLPPIDRVDLSEQCDIDEEVFRFYPADKIVPSFEGRPRELGGLTDSQKRERRIRQKLADRGLDEILSYTLVSKEQDKVLRVFDDKESYVILNPRTKDHEVVRSDLLSSRYRTRKYNLSHQHDSLSLFEISPVDTKEGIHTYLSLGLVGKTSLCEESGKRPFDFFDRKGIIETVFALIGLNPSRYRLSYTKNSSFHPGAACDIYRGKKLIGTFGKLHPGLFKEERYLGEIDLGYLLSMNYGKTKFVPFNSYPLVRRDLSLKRKDGVSYQRVKETILKARNPFVKGVLFFDDFKDEAKERYLGISLLLSKEDGTLKDEEISSALTSVVKELFVKLGIGLKGE